LCPPARAVNFTAAAAISAIHRLSASLVARSDFERAMRVSAERLPLPERGMLLGRCFGTIAGRRGLEAEAREWMPLHHRAASTLSGRRYFLIGMRFARDVSARARADDFTAGLP